MICNFPLFESKLLEPIASVFPKSLSAHEFPNCSIFSPTIVEIFSHFVLYLNICNFPLFESKLLDPTASISPASLSAHALPNCSAVSPNIVELFDQLVLY